MKYIGIDYGTKKTGIALSDDLGTVAFPSTVLLTDNFLLSAVVDIIKEKDVKAIVVGESRNMSGDFNIVDTNIKKFVGTLKGLLNKDMEVHYEDERFTTKQARSLPNEGAIRGDVANNKKSRGWTSTKVNKLADAQAAAIILQSFLDKFKNLS